MQTQEQFIEILKFVFPEEIVRNFNIIDIKEAITSSGKLLHVYFEEKNIPSDEQTDKQLKPNGFYEDSEVKDFPLRDRKVVLHIKRRRWVDIDGKSYSRQWDFTASGTRYSKEFAFFFNECFGSPSCSSPIS